jgi:hypothetical protein
MVYFKSLRTHANSTLYGTVIKYFMYTSKLNLALHQAAKIMCRSMSKTVCRQTIIETVHRRSTYMYWFLTTLQVFNILNTFVRLSAFVCLEFLDVYPQTFCTHRRRGVRHTFHILRKYDMTGFR